MSLFGLGSTKEKSWIEPAVRQMQEANYAGAQSTPASYTPTSPGLISQYLNPYTQNVVDKTGEAFGRGLQMIDNQVGDAAMAAHAYGGSRHGVAQGVAQSDALNNYSLLSANLYNQGYGQALDAAQRENALSYQYPLSRQQTLNQTLGMVRPMTIGKGQDPGAAMSNFGGLLQGAGNIASFFAGL